MQQKRAELAKTVGMSFLF